MIKQAPSVFSKNSFQIDERGCHCYNPYSGPFWNIYHCFMSFSACHLMQKFDCQHLPIHSYSSMSEMSPMSPTSKFRTSVKLENELQ